MEWLRQWAQPWGDLASVAGLIVSAVGFAVTIVGVYLSKRAAERAHEAAKRTRALLIKTNSIADLSAALTIMEEIRRLQREGVWNGVLLDRYTTLREKLQTILASERQLSDEHKVAIREALEGMRRMETKVEASLAPGAQVLSAVKLNQIVGVHIDKLREPWMALRLAVHGTGDDDDRE